MAIVLALPAHTLHCTCFRGQRNAGRCDDDHRERRNEWLYDRDAGAYARHSVRCYRREP